MSFRLRVTLVAAVAVALAVLGAGSLVYAQVERQLIASVDEALVASARPPTAAPPRGFPFRFARPPLSGRPDIFAQVIDASGQVVRADGEPTMLLVTPAARAIAGGSQPAGFSNVVLEGTRIRVYTAPFAPGLALQLARPLDEIDRTLAETRVMLGLVALGGVLLAAALGAIVSSAALAPVARLTATVEEVTRTRDLRRRIAATGNDELARLGRSFDAMLGALDASLRSQRQLVADASHELRTPLTSLRTNLELLARGQPADEAERRALLLELVAQMERLSALVGDLIDLAREDEAPLTIEQVRLDEVAAEAIEDVRRRYPAVRFELVAQPTAIEGVRSRIARAVTNLLDNAAKWSPQGARVEVSVADGEVTVRDHGPGVTPEDSAHVFDRFWRAPNAHHLPGSGLGLAIVRDVAESHGGSVAVEHPAGGGARFRLRLLRA